MEVFDNPNYRLSTQPFDEDIFNHWQRPCGVSLRDKNELGFVSGSSSKCNSDSALLSL